MPRVNVVTSDSEMDVSQTKHKEPTRKKQVSPPTSEPTTENEPVPAEGGDEDEEEEEEEYEIEDVIDSQKGYFQDGKFGYFVKWKGYPASDNSWVHEDDAANAKDLILKYWENKRKAGKGVARKSTDAGKAKISRKSSTVEDARESSPHAKKRPRPKKDEQEQSDKDLQATSDDDDARAKKKSRKSQGTAVKKGKKSHAEDEDDLTMGSMKKHMTISSWENLVERIDTIERGDDGHLYVYFTIKNSGDRMRELSKLCAERFPQKLIKFYESNLRWRVEGEEAN